MKGKRLLKKGKGSKKSKKKKQEKKKKKKKRKKKKNADPPSSLPSKSPTGYLSAEPSLFPTAPPTLSPLSSPPSRNHFHMKDSNLPSYPPSIRSNVSDSINPTLVSTTTPTSTPSEIPISSTTVSFRFDTALASDAVSNKAALEEITFNFIRPRLEPDWEVLGVYLSYAVDSSVERLRRSLQTPNTIELYMGFEVDARPLKANQADSSLHAIINNDLCFNDENEFADAIAAILTNVTGCDVMSNPSMTPSSLPTGKPSHMPTAFPTVVPTTTQIPSSLPTTSSLPSQSPTISTHPSFSLHPTQSVSESPSITTFISTDALSYTCGDVISVTFQNARPDRSDWIGLYSSSSFVNGALPVGAIDWMYACGSRSCSVPTSSNVVTFEINILPTETQGLEGSLQVFLIDDNGAPYTDIVAMSDEFNVDGCSSEPSHEVGLQMSNMSYGIYYENVYLFIFK